jgi:hypothetical protein
MYVCVFGKKFGFQQQNIKRKKNQAPIKKHYIDTITTHTHIYQLDIYYYFRL